MNDYAEQIKNEWERQVSELQKPNIMIVGGTGVGKSALVNYIFGENVAEEGSGEPITKGMKKYEPKDTPIVLFDTEGYEISKDGIDMSNFNTKILPKIDEYQSKELKEQIHLAWYCISISNNRITDFDIESIKTIQNKLKNRCAIVFTKCDYDEEDENGKGVKAELFKKILKQKGIHLDVFEMSTDKELALSLDFEKLIDWSSKSLPSDALRQAFIASQKHSITSKVKLAHKQIQLKVPLAAGIGATPIPFADAPVISGLQIEMAIKIASIFGVSSMGNKVITLLQTQIASTLGKMLVSSLTKFIPILGSVINAAVAGALTYGIGVGLIKVFEKAHLDYLETGKEPDWAELFASDFLWEYVESGINEYKKTKEV